MASVVNYKASPTAIEFHNSRAFVKGIMGPFGSGKSVAVCFDIFMTMARQAVGNDGKRRSRWIIARNTFNELETTTIQTWRDWFPEHIFGGISRKPPYRQMIKYEDIEAEVIFLALDKPEDQKKLLSFEVTGIWFNEARQIPEELIHAALGRVGRFPARKDKPDYVDDDKWPTWSGILLDTNPPDDEHWYYRAAEEHSWAVDEFGERIDPDSLPESRQWKFWKQPSGLSPNAENIENLPGGTEYYKRMLSAGKSKEWIDVHVHGKYGFVKHGLPVFEDIWNPDMMTAKSQISIFPGGEIYVGVDCSGRHPATVFCQKTKLGQIQVLRELCITEDAGVGAVTYARMLKSYMNDNFPNHSFYIFGDPAGDFRTQTDERTYFDILRAEGINIKSPRDLAGNRISTRLETVKFVMGQLVNGQPKLLVSPDCKILLRGLNGGYRFRRISTASDTRYDEKPEKNRYSDVQDAMQYVLCGMGETKKMMGRGKHGRTGRTVTANTEFSVI